MSEKAKEILERALDEGAETHGFLDRADLYEEAIREALAALRGPEPDWGKAPEWAMWWAVDPNGLAFWSAFKPMVDGMEWSNAPNSRERPASRVTLPLGCDWRMTLRRRPDSEASA